LVFIIQLYRDARSTKHKKNSYIFLVYIHNHLFLRKSNQERWAGWDRYSVCNVSGNYHLALTVPIVPCIWVIVSVNMINELQELATDRCQIK